MSKKHKDAGKPEVDTSTPLFLYGLRHITESAAVAAYEWIGRGNKEDGDGAAVDAMRAALNDLPIDGVVVIGEGEKDEAPQLFNGEQIGSSRHKRQFDIAVDPVEGTSYLAKGLTNSLAVIALAPRGSMFDPGPAFYMEKLAVPPAARGQIDPTWSTEKKLKRLAECLDKPVSELSVYVLEKPRHKKLVEEIYAAGARASLYPAGDVAGALLAGMVDNPIDCLMGTGGTPEGVMCAVALRALGADFMGRLDPQLQSEAEAVKEAGLCTDTWYKMDELVTSDDLFFCCSGITHGLMLDGVERTKDFDRVQTLMIAGKTGERQVLTNYRQRRG